MGDSKANQDSYMFISLKKGFVGQTFVFISSK